MLIFAIATLLPSAEAAAVKNHVTEMIEAISSGKVARIKIWLADENAESFAAITPQTLEQTGELVTFTDVKRHKATPLLLEALRGLEPALSSGSSDYRVGIKLFSVEEKPIHSLYITALMDDAVSDGQGFVFSKPFALGKMREWIREIRPPQLKHQ